MKVLVYPHAMEVGGSQLNAIELAGAVRDLGHEVSVISEPGPLSARVADLQLPHLLLPQDRRRPSPAVVRRLRGMLRSPGFDVVHGYEWTSGMEAWAAASGRSDAAAVCTVMSMAVAPFLPPSLPLVVGTAAIQQRTGSGRRGPVHLIEPPVDVLANAPGVPTEEYRARFGLTERTQGPGGERLLDVAVVCRLVPELKLEGVLAAVDAVGSLAVHRAVRLVVVGDGPARDLVEQHAARANERAGRTVVVLTGELIDPRPAYAAADVLLGMGGSALRALAFGRPLVVQGERGFWELLTPETVHTFLHQGWYGIGEGTGGVERLSRILTRLLDDAELRERLGSYGRGLAVDRFSLQAAARVQEGIYRAALGTPAAPGRRTEAARAVGGLLSHKVHRRYERLRGREQADDFNAADLAGAVIPGPAPVGQPGH